MNPTIEMALASLQKIRGSYRPPQTLSKVGWYSRLGCLTGPESCCAACVWKNPQKMSSARLWKAALNKERRGVREEGEGRNGGQVVPRSLVRAGRTRLSVLRGAGGPPGPGGRPWIWMSGAFQEKKEGSCERLMKSFSRCALRLAQVR